MAVATAGATLRLLRTAPRRVLRHAPPPCCRPFSALSSSSSSSSSSSDLPPRTSATSAEEAEPRATSLPLSKGAWSKDPDFRRWKDKEKEILQDVGPTIVLVKNILHSYRYMDGERLNPEDEKVVVEKLLVYHPCSEDKIGCGLYAIMVDRHPQFGGSRCLFVVRTDGMWIDFSYQKCLRAYLHEKYSSSDAERFIKEHFKRT